LTTSLKFLSFFGLPFAIFINPQLLGFCRLLYEKATR